MALIDMQEVVARYVRDSLDETVGNVSLDLSNLGVRCVGAGLSDDGDSIVYDIVARLPPPPITITVNLPGDVCRVCERATVPRRAARWPPVCRPEESDPADPLACRREAIRTRSTDG